MSTFRKVVIVYLLFTVLALCLATAAWGEHPAVAAYHQGQSDAFRSSVADLRVELEGVASEDWSDAHLAAYENSVFWLMYHAYTSYVFENDHVPDSPNDLITSGLLMELPGNPLRGWEPVRVLDAWSGFSAGDLALQVAPASHYSLVGSFECYDLRPLSFELSIYGPSEDHIQGVAASPAQGNSWATVPGGILVMAGVYSETADETLQKIADRVEQIQEGD